ncbi:MAG TPA: rRNA pseudouridine synthase [Candidatus Coproplasma excrementipullorum]|nr:rRNA pseudouridine synthase [Candidatus Coproplasma excrementipullorum]
MRLNKFLAACGVASRRSCDELIKDGKVNVNGKVAGLGLEVGEGDEVTVNGNKVVLKKNEYYILNKPKGYLSTVSDDKGRKTVMDLMPSSVGRIYPVGRLDYDSEGLLILTTDGELAQRLTHPSNEVPKTYLVKIEGTATEATLNPIRSGIEIEGGYVTKKCKAHIVETNKEYTKIHITITEGKNREIRKMFAAIGREVTLLKRIKVGELTLRGLDRGKWRKLNKQEVAYLMSL